MYKIVIFISFNPFVFHIIRTGIIELKITNWLLTFFGISFFLATTMFLVFRKFWNLLVRKVARSTNREIELNASSNTSVVRLSNHFAALLHQIGLTVSQSVVDYLIIPCFTTDWKVIPSKLWLVHDLSFLLSYLCFFAPFVSSPLLRRWTQHFFRFNFLTRPFLPFKNLHHQLWIWIFASIFQFFIVEVDSSGHERTNLPKLCEHTSKQRTIWIRNVSRN